MLAGLQGQCVAGTTVGVGGLAHQATGKLPRIRLGILGDGPERSKLEKLTVSLGITKNVDFLGYDHRVEAYLHATRVLIMVSMSEALPAVAVEAVFCGVPVILPCVGDIPSLFVHDENALLVQPGDRERLVTSIVKALTDERAYERLRRGALKIRERFAAQWNKGALIEEWEKVLSFAVTGRPARG